ITQASLPTVRRAIQTLSDLNWIHVVGQAEANGGRPAMLFGIDNRHYLVIGLHLQLPGIRLIAANLSGDVLETKDAFIEMVPEHSAIIQKVSDFIAVIRSKFPERVILGIGIASPGFVDLKTGDIIAIGRVPSWVNFPICRHLSAMTGLPIQIANDVDCMAIAELYQDQRLMQKNLVYIGFCEGVKASLFLGGQLYKGTIGNVGLISADLLHLCNRDSSEELKNLITLPGFIIEFGKRVRKLPVEKQKYFDMIMEAEDQHEQFITILETALSDKVVCYPLVHDLIKAVSIAIASVIFVIQPDVLVLGGLLSSMPKNLFIELENSIRGYIPTLISNNLIIIQGVMDALNIAAIGAVHHFLQTSVSDILGDN
ncbi:MAG: ROK family protein, partial [Anaerolineales bacterium]